jgi:hypothetical protein
MMCRRHEVAAAFTLQQPTPVMLTGGLPAIDGSKERLRYKQRSQNCEAAKSSAVVWQIL